MRKHVVKCWGKEALVAADTLQNVSNARESVATFARSGSIAAAFKAQSSQLATYSIRQHTKSELRYVTFCFIRDYVIILSVGQS